MQLINSILNFIIPSAYADTTTAAAAQPQQSTSSFLMIMAVLMFFMYFALWRPQSKRAKEHKTLISSLAKGDEVVTAGGILGTINKITDNHIVLLLNENMEIIVQKSSVVNVLPKGTIKAI